MREKITSALFIILANLVLMVHAIVPHHHHNNNLCFDLIAEEIHAVHEICDIQHDEHEHEHNQEEEKDHCFLQNVYALSSGDVKQNIRNALKISFSQNDFLLVSLLDQGVGLTDNPYFFIQSLSQNHHSKYLSLYSRATGLRAPPQVS